mmetsp:Transcript_5760/g.11234  ORF Transcript_5760/g.11234 Transcript_5760/m.11234 type:complete len:412 (-) Transcript_5760:106-1341(-)
MDLLAFAVAAATGTLVLRIYGGSSRGGGDDNDTSSLYFVTSTNEPLPDNQPPSDREQWHRATYVLVMHDPPDMFYEPKEWSHTPVLLCKLKNKEGNEKLALPCGPLRRGETYIDCGTRVLRSLTGVDVSQPQNCLHHLFTFPYNTTGVKQWADFFECVHRGALENLKDGGKDFVCMSLEELKEKVQESVDLFEEESYYAARLYFQRQMDLRAKRRLLKGYSSVDLDNYGMRTEHKPIVFKADEDDSERGGALDYTMQTDDGMSPKLLLKADIVLLGVSRAGKTPLSLLLSQTKGIKVANIPLVLEVPPPRQLISVDARRVFVITQKAEHLQQVRRERLRREMKNRRVGSRSTYADPDYVQRDLDNATELARKHGYTIVDITDRAMEEAASLIMSKLKERFPDQDFGDTSML